MWITTAQTHTHTLTDVVSADCQKNIYIYIYSSQHCYVIYCYCVYRPNRFFMLSKRRFYGFCTKAVVRLRSLRPSTIMNRMYSAVIRKNTTTTLPVEEVVYFNRTVRVPWTYKRWEKRRRKSTVKRAERARPRDDHRSRRYSEHAVEPSVRVRVVHEWDLRSFIDVTRYAI